MSATGLVVMGTLYGGGRAPPHTPPKTSTRLAGFWSCRGSPRRTRRSPSACSQMRPGFPPMASAFAGNEAETRARTSLTGTCSPSAGRWGRLVTAVTRSSTPRAIAVSRAGNVSSS
jgi:hypothetical protein